MRYGWLVALVLGTQMSVAQGARLTERAQKVIAQVIDLDYLPFDYSQNGCFARSIYMSAEMALERIPSTAVFMLAKKGQPLLTTKSGQTWNFHVAPLVRDADGRKLIFDPSLSPQGMTEEKWLCEMGSTRRQVERVAVPGFYYFGFNTWKKDGLKYTNPFSSVICGNASDCTSFINNPNRSLEIIIDNFEEMPSLHVEMLEHACGLMAQIIVNHRGKTLDQTHGRMTRLKQRTAHIINSLGAKNMLRRFPISVLTEVKKGQTFFCGRGFSFKLDW